MTTFDDNNGKIKNCSF